MQRKSNGERIVSSANDVWTPGYEPLSVLHSSTEINSKWIMYLKVWHKIINHLKESLEHISMVLGYAKVLKNENKSKIHKKKKLDFNNKETKNPI